MLLDAVLQQRFS